MTRAGPPPHLVRRNHVTRVPRTFVYLDSEAVQKVKPSERVQSFRLAVTALDRRYHHRPDWAPRVFADHFDARSLWEWVDATTKAKARTVVVAHNLGYDLRVTKALTELPRLGWELGAIRLDGGHAWATFKRETRTLLMVDSMSWVPMALDKLATMVGMSKCALPAWDDSEEAWLQRCRTDVEILATVWRRLMTWVEADDLGNWRPTGAGQSWSAFRHRFMHDDLLVHDDPEARAAERRSAYTGRCEAWAHGKLRGGPFSEWDFTTAYAVVGRDCGVPVKLLRCHHDVDIGGWHVLRRRGRVLADVTIETTVPTVPTLHDGRVCWPVGVFASTLWENELQLALDNGARVTINRAWSYESAPALHGFCSWVLDQLNDVDSALDPIVRAALKHWSRALIGRFGAKYPRWREWGVSSVDDVRVSDVIDGDNGERWRMLQLGSKLWRETEPADAADCLPSVMAWIMAECRVRLYKAACAAGLENVAYLDTDALVTTRAGSERLRRANIEGLRVKSEWRSLRVLGPRQIVTDGRVRAAGVARDSIMVGPETFESEAWRQLETSLRRGEAESVTITTRRQRLRGTDRRRLHLPDGSTAPLHIVP